MNDEEIKKNLQQMHSLRIKEFWISTITQGTVSILLCILLIKLTWF